MRSCEKRICEMRIDERRLNPRGQNFELPPKDSQNCIPRDRTAFNLKKSCLCQTNRY